MTVRMLVAKELFLQAMNLPADTEIVGAKCEYPFRDIEFYITNPDIPQGATEVCPMFMSHYAECGHVYKVEMMDWGASE